MPQDLAATLGLSFQRGAALHRPGHGEKLVEKFGADSLEVIANEPLRRHRAAGDHAGQGGRDFE